MNELHGISPQDVSSSKKRKITLIYTGGTIGALEKNNTLASEGTGEVLYQILLNEYPQIKYDYELNLKTPFSLLSENIVPPDWGMIANSIAAEINEDVDGIVVAHGTDTLPYTTAAVSFMLSEVPIPVVFTGSLIPPTWKGTDAIQNLFESISFAAKSQLAGVYVVFKAKDNSRDIFCGTRLMSISPYSKYFGGIDPEDVGKIRNGAVDKISIDRYPKSYRLVGRKVTTDTKIDPNIAFFEVFPGFDPRYIKNAADYGAKGVILKLFHSGTACTRHGMYSLVPIIEECTKKGILIFGTPISKSKNEKDAYSTTKQLLKAGLEPLSKMTLEAAIVKLMWVLGHQKNGELVRKEMERNIAGEIITERQSGR